MSGLPSSFIHLQLEYSNVKFYPDCFRRDPVTVYFTKKRCSMMARIFYAKIHQNILLIIVSYIILFCYRRYKVKDLPDSEEDLSEWLRNLFKEKVKYICIIGRGFIDLIRSLSSSHSDKSLKRKFCTFRSSEYTQVTYRDLFLWVNIGTFELLPRYFCKIFTKQHMGEAQSLCFYFRTSCRQTVCIVMAHKKY